MPSKLLYIFYLHNGMFFYPRKSQDQGECEHNLSMLIIAIPQVFLI